MTKRVKIEADSIGYGKISIDGIDVSHVVKGVQVDIHKNEPTAVLVSLMPSSVQMDLEGVVGLMSSEMAVLESLDPKEVDRIAMDRLGFGEDKSLTELVIDVLKEQLRGA